MLAKNKKHIPFNGLRQRYTDLASHTPLPLTLSLSSTLRFFIPVFFKSGVDATSFGTSIAGNTKIGLEMITTEVNSLLRSSRYAISSLVYIHRTTNYRFRQLLIYRVENQILG